MTGQESFELGNEAGFHDGYDGFPYNSTPLSGTPLQFHQRYRAGYLSGYEDGQDAYERSFQ